MVNEYLVKILENIKKVGSLFLRAIIFGVIYGGVYAIFLNITLPIVDQLGIIRVVIIGMISKLVEEGIFYLVKNSS